MKEVLLYCMQTELQYVFFLCDFKKQRKKDSHVCLCLCFALHSPDREQVTTASLNGPLDVQSLPGKHSLNNC